MAGRAIARTAVVGTAVGIASLAVLAVLATTITAQATRQVRRVQDTTRVWNDIAGRINAEDAALREYLATGGSEYRRTQRAATSSRTTTRRNSPRRSAPSTRAAAP